MNKNFKGRELERFLSKNKGHFDKMHPGVYEIVLEDMLPHYMIADRGHDLLHLDNMINIWAVSKKHESFKNLNSGDSATFVLLTIIGHDMGCSYVPKADHAAKSAEMFLELLPKFREAFKDKLDEEGEEGEKDFLWVFNQIAEDIRTHSTGSESNSFTGKYLQDLDGLEFLGCDTFKGVLERIVFRVIAKYFHENNIINDVWSIEYRKAEEELGFNSAIRSIVTKYSDIIEVNTIKKLDRVYSHINYEAFTQFVTKEMLIFEYSKTVGGKQLITEIATRLLKEYVIHEVGRLKEMHSLVARLEGGDYL